MYTQVFYRYMYVYVYIRWYSDFMLSGLLFLHSASTSLSRIACLIQPCHQPVLVWTREYYWKTPNFMPNLPIFLPNRIWRQSRNYNDL
jgi:hypothetical protein